MTGLVELAEKELLRRQRIIDTWPSAPTPKIRALGNQLPILGVVSSLLVHDDGMIC